jgi:hypothetical protein
MLVLGNELPIYAPSWGGWRVQAQAASQRPKCRTQSRRSRDELLCVPTFIGCHIKSLYALAFRIVSA